MQKKLRRSKLFPYYTSIISVTAPWATKRVKDTWVQNTTKWPVFKRSRPAGWTRHRFSLFVQELVCKGCVGSRWARWRCDTLWVALLFLALSWRWVLSPPLSPLAASARMAQQSQWAHLCIAWGVGVICI